MERLSRLLRRAKKTKELLAWEKYRGNRTVSSRINEKSLALYEQRARADKGSAGENALKALEEYRS